MTPMRFWFFLFHSIACAVGFTAFIVSLLLYVKHRKKAIFLYALFLGSIGLEVGALLLSSVESIAVFKDPQTASLVQSLSRLLEFLSITSFPVILLFFVHHLMGVPITRVRRNIFVAVPVVSILAYAAWRASGAEIYLHGVLLSLVYSAGIYVLVIIFSQLSSIGDLLLKRAIKTFLMISGIYLPVYMIDSLADNIPGFPFEDTYTCTLPIYFFVLNSLGIYFAVKYFDQPVYMDGDQITEHFDSRFNISKRESEIVAQVITGLSNREIADKLFISIKTVENHLYNIYQKTGVRNRVQLTNLIQTNKRD